MKIEVIERAIIAGKAHRLEVHTPSRGAPLWYVASEFGRLFVFVAEPPARAAWDELKALPPPARKPERIAPPKPGKMKTVGTPFRVDEHKVLKTEIVKGVPHQLQVATDLTHGRKRYQIADDLGILSVHTEFKHAIGEWNRLTARLTVQKAA